ncbi:MAG: ParA family protein [Alphaproteobacteria bacterium]|nr:ParA family protein [Alphaproteobacteria bacterium]MCB9698928.1 ParA family protein [Alphaproteobacteria bacterium]
MVVMVANVKGGVGKTTVSTHLAAWFAHLGDRTALADLDKQQSALAWLERRPASLPTIHGLDLSKGWEKPKGYDRIVVDVPAALRKKDLEELVKAADAIVVPVQASVFDEAGTQRFVDLVSEFKVIRKNKRPIGVVANRYRARTRASKRLEDFLETLPVQTLARLRDTQTYANLAEVGSSLFDDPSHKLVSWREEWRPLLDFVQEA